MITFTLKDVPDVPLEAENLSPDVLAGLDPDAVRALPVYLGKRRLPLSDFFDVEFAPGASDGGASAAGPEAGETVEIRGDCSRVKWIGKGMTRGVVRIVGHAGMHLGSQMKGGSIHVTGNVSDWAGAEMRGGLIHIGGNAGGQIGAAYRGGSTGMREGLILIEGAAGLEVGMRMKRGTIAIKGRVRDFAGLQMKGGTLVLLGGAEIRTGAWMSRGTIISTEPLRLLPTFLYACRYQPNALRLYSKFLAPFGFHLPVDPSLGAYQRYSGDNAVPGKGEILVWNPHAS